MDHPHVGSDPGIFITTVKAGSVAGRDGRLKPGDRILAVCTCLPYYQNGKKKLMIEDNDDGDDDDDDDDDDDVSFIKYTGSYSQVFKK